MTAAPEIENSDLRRTRHRLRSHTYAPIHATATQQPRDASGHTVNRPKDCKSLALFALRNFQNLVRTSSIKARTPLKSP